MFYWLHQALFTPSCTKIRQAATFQIIFRLHVYTLHYLCSKGHTGSVIHSNILSSPHHSESESSGEPRGKRSGSNFYYLHKWNIVICTFLLIIFAKSKTQCNSNLNFGKSTHMWVSWRSELDNGLYQGFLSCNESERMHRGETSKAPNTKNFVKTRPGM